MSAALLSQGDAGVILTRPAAKAHAAAAQVVVGPPQPYHVSASALPITGALRGCRGRRQPRKMRRCRDTGGCYSRKAPGPAGARAQLEGTHHPDEMRPPKGDRSQWAQSRCAMRRWPNAALSSVGKVSADLRVLQQGLGA